MSGALKRTVQVEKLCGRVSTFSDAVAILVPTKFKAMQLRAASCAAMSKGAFSVLARSTM